MLTVAAAFRHGGPCHMTHRKSGTARRSRKPSTRTAGSTARSSGRQSLDQSTIDQPSGRPMVVGIGASAGGLEAFTQLLQHLPTDTGMAFVLVQHLDPARDSALSEILSRVTSLSVREVADNQPVEPNHIYVIPPNANLSMEGGVLKLGPRQRCRAASIHRFVFRIAGAGPARAGDRCDPFGHRNRRHVGIGSNQGRGRDHVRAG